ncbi:iron complex transport system substrate-binding protein [Kitasatospora sp. MMS16-BH015]|uniref:ABC transporter substrate-binding protein n=1 Tax=Kitasatospora sp. MMS16-BH015 TaxID=2018025 RepID=UPI000CA31AFB|nr:iron-siderophore ABC transporter substrate-binding protein [Kitasatospora sp. MMS16-BH015]AUG79143.1 iron complex transport system substrate-binding protein [Kitasatospora sp. MMS16-BH015]
MPRQLPRRTALTGLGAFLLTGCATTGHRLPAPAPGTPAAPSSPNGTDSAAPSPAAVPSTTVTAATGPVLVPGAPQRVIALDTAELDSAMTLGLTPVGATRVPADPEFPDYWPASRFSVTNYVGPIGAPDPQLIAALRPDVILGNQTRDGAHYEELSRLAPTVLTQTTGYPWKADFQLHAQALGRTEQAAAVVESYADHLTQATAAIGSVGAAGKRISLVRFVEGSPTIRLYARQNFLGTVLADLQLPRPDSQNADTFAVEIPPDQIAKADADYLFYATYGAAQTAATLTTPAWHALSAVQNHRAFPVSDQLWYQGIGYTGAHYVIAELQRFLGA